MSDLYRHPEWLALLRGVCENPWSDAPRLTAAEWLDEHGDPVRAEFIRAQVELARAQADEPDPGTRAREVWHLRQWLPALNRVRSIPGIEDCLPAWTAPARPEWRPEFRRGFVERLTLGAVDWLRYADMLLASHPVLEVDLTGVPTTDELTEWADAPVELPEGADRDTETWPQLVGGFLQRAWPRVTFRLPSVPLLVPSTPRSGSDRRPLAAPDGDCPNCGSTAFLCPDGAIRCWNCGLRV